MGRTFITGDTHSTRDFSKLFPILWPAGVTLNKKDILIIAGDWGAYFGPSASDKSHSKMLRNWYENKPWTTVVVLGNHEDYYQINQLPKVKKFGGEVLKVSESVFILERGAIYTINGKTIWTMGGGLSIDRARRTYGIDWWIEEQPNHDEHERGMDCLAKVDGKVDYIITHVAPQSALKGILGCYGIRHPKYYDPLSKYLDDILYDHVIDYKWWFCGHYHEDRTYPDKKLTVLFQNIQEI